MTVIPTFKAVSEGSCCMIWLNFRATNAPAESLTIPIVPPEYMINIEAFGLTAPV
jgi:hypothetical protein